MKRTIIAIAATAALLAPSAASAAPWNGYHNMGFLGSTITRLVNARLLRRHITSVHANRTWCIAQSNTSAECLVYYSNGQRETVGVTIAANGSEFLTH